MTVYVVSILIGLLLSEVAYHVVKCGWIRKELSKSGLLLDQLRKAEGDDEQQALLLRSGWVILQFSLVMLAMFVLLALLLFIVPSVLKWDVRQEVIYYITVSVVAMIWVFLRRFRHTKSHLPDGSVSFGQVTHQYGILERCLHWVALNPVVCHITFDLERQFVFSSQDFSVASDLENSKTPDDGAVYVCGLARSGTTILLHILDQIDDFRSLTYRDMPFVLAPNLWKKIARNFQRDSVSVMRAHGDNIYVNFDSPEGFEEVFWRTFGGTKPGVRCIDAGEPTSEMLAAFTDYRAMVTNSTGEPNAVRRRYLSKNNNNLLRLSSLAADPKSTVLLVYRDPVATARSLYRQHLRFCVAQTEDRFTRTYMGWLAHHEFGLDHLPFCFAVPGMDVSLAPDDPNYWLDYWNAVYLHVLAQSNLRVNLVCYEALCAEPEEALDAILTVLGVKADTDALARMIKAPSDTQLAEDFNPELLQRARVTYQSLLSSPKNIYTPTQRMS